ncbi:hypothetical protein [Bradyrhizobium sp. SBR1B]|uniref:hypothetical protein n=1 Tax=Bradyrhizobium sp. SBR1B TaxID=2663836 RepID=UPI001605ABBC|nr:hypothetical protein [Bradyrhizobium sp. SBR1B]MBB4377242.1 hypothetical protein [Bradyrhizobium sp. SBR1B]
MPKPQKSTLPERIELVGAALYGAGRWTAALARGLRMSRSQLFEYRRAGRIKYGRDIDGEMLALIDRERDAAAERGVALTKLRNLLLVLRKGASDAA